MERRTSYKADQRINKKEHEKPKLRTTKKPDRVESGLHNGTTKKVTTHNAARSRVFIRSHTAGRYPQ
jgi:hypothetical protein